MSLQGRLPFGAQRHHISHRITLDEALKMYEVWRDKKDKAIKIVIDPWAKAT